MELNYLWSVSLLASHSLKHLPKKNFKIKINFKCTQGTLVAFKGTKDTSKGNRTHMKEPRECNFHINGQKKLGCIVCMLSYI